MAEGNQPQTRRLYLECAQTRNVKNTLSDIKMQLTQLECAVENAQYRGKCEVQVKTSHDISELQNLFEGVQRELDKLKERIVDHAGHHPARARDSGYCGSSTSTGGISDEPTAMAERTDYPSTPIQEEGDALHFSDGHYHDETQA